MEIASHHHLTTIYNCNKNDEDVDSVCKIFKELSEREKNEFYKLK